MTRTATFYEEARELGEVVRRGLRYRMYYDAERELTIYVLIPGQGPAATLDADPLAHAIASPRAAAK